MDGHTLACGEAARVQNTQVHPLYKDTPASWVQSQLITVTERLPHSPGAFNSSHGLCAQLVSKDRAQVRAWTVCVTSGRSLSSLGFPICHSSLG